MPARKSLEFVRKFFAEAGCSLLASTYVNAHTKMPYICGCGKRAEINFNNFQNGQRCKSCGYQLVSTTLNKLKGLSFREVKRYFKDSGCTLLANEYINSKTKMPYICECGNKSWIVFSHFERGVRCKKCGYKNRKKTPVKLTINDVRKAFDAVGYILLATEYHGVLQHLPYICGSCGCETEIRFSDFQDGHRCKECANKKLSVSKKYSFEFVRLYFSNQDCELLSGDYVDSVTPLDYRCSCGAKSVIRFYAFLRGQRCVRCRPIKIEQTKRQWQEADLDVDLLNLLNPFSG